MSCRKDCLTQTLPLLPSLSLWKWHILCDSSVWPVMTFSRCLSLSWLQTLDVFAETHQTSACLLGPFMSKCNHIINNGMTASAQKSPVEFCCKHSCVYSVSHKNTLRQSLRPIERAYISHKTSALLKGTRRLSVAHNLLRNHFVVCALTTFTQ